MLKSMTGFGKSTGEYLGKKITIEVKSLNSKTLDFNIRCAPQYKEIEIEIRQIASSLLERGKVDMSITLETVQAEKSNEINKTLAESYYQDIKQLSESLGIQVDDYMSLILRMPDIYSTSKENLSDEEKKLLLKLVEEACLQLNDFRNREGAQLASEFTDRICEIRRLLEEVDQFEKPRIEGIKERIQKALEEYSSYDEGRLEQELIFYVEKIDISEEKMRLANHLEYFLQTMNDDFAGKKLGFITQEIGREINTLGSKSYNVDLQKIVVNMKDNLEKIKEQVLNTL